MNKIRDKIPSEIYFESLQKIGDISFSPRQIDIIACIQKGRRASKIAEILSIEPKTIESHIRKITEKLTQCRGNSREAIIDFIERSDKYQELQAYYSALLIQHKFEVILNQLSKSSVHKNNAFSLFYGKSEEKSPFLPALEKHLNLLKLKKREFSLKKSVSGILISWSALSEASYPPENLFSFNPSQVYYQSFFALLKKLFPEVDIDKITEEFEVVKHNVQNIRTEAPPLPAKPSLPPEALLSPSVEVENNVLLSRFLFKPSHISFKHLVVWGLCLVTFYLVGRVYYSYKNIQVPIVARSDLAIPHENVLLHRQKLLDEIDQKLNQQKGIQSIAIIGIGGAGKTTLARQYARDQNSSVIWEINAETQESLKNSFESLARSLARSPEENKRLREILNTKDFENKNKNILLFVKNALRNYPHWVLILDNVEKFSAIKNYFPSDPILWGLGKVILTTRDSHIGKNNQVKSFLKVGELSPSEKESLFKAINSKGHKMSLVKGDNEDRTKFLENLPPFPLDIALAAYFLEGTHISFDDYLFQIKKNNNTFLSTQKELLINAINYTNTRYNLVVLPLEKLLKEHKEFYDLLLLISLIDSQNIPKSFLEYYKDKPLVDKFIYYLKRYSIIKNNNPDFNLGPNFSIHRITQSIILDYILNNGEDKINAEKLKNIARKYIEYIKSNKVEDVGTLKKLLLHGRIMASHDSLLDNQSRANLMSELGFIYHFLGDLQSAEELLINSIKYYKKGPNGSSKLYGKSLVDLGLVLKDLNQFDKAITLFQQGTKILSINGGIDYAQALLELGDAYRVIGEYKKAKCFIEQSVNHFQEISAEKSEGLAYSLGILGNLYRILGEYDKAESFTRQSCKLYKDHFSSNVLEYGRSLQQLGNVYTDLGDNKRALQLLKKSISILNKNFNNHIYYLRTISYLGIIHKNLGQYQVASKIFENNLLRYKQLYSDSKFEAAWTAEQLADVYIVSGLYDKAKNILDYYVAEYEKRFGRNNIRTQGILAKLAIVYSEINKNIESKNILEESLSTHLNYFKHDHPKIAWLNLNLASIYYKLGDILKAKQLLIKSLQANERKFGKNHVEVARVLQTLGKVKLLEGDYDHAEEYIKRAEEIFHMSGHPDIYTSFETLSELYQKKANSLEKEAKIEEAKLLYTKASNELKKALTVLEANFPPNSPHIKRIQEKLKTLQEI